MMLLIPSVQISLFATLDMRNATIILSDGGAVDLEIKVGEGNLTYSEKIEYEYVKDRGILDDVRLGDDVPMEVSFDVMWEVISGTGEVGEYLRGEHTGAVSSDADTCRPYACDIVITYAEASTGCGNAGTITLGDFRVESVDHDLSGGSLSVSGKCNATAAVTS